MFRKDKMSNNGREKDNIFVEKSSLISNNYKNYRSYERNNNNNNNSLCFNDGYYLSDVGSSSLGVDHNKYYVGPTDELSLTREFQRMEIANNVVPVPFDYGRFGDCNVSKIRRSSTENFGGLEGFLNDNGNGNGSAMEDYRFSGELNGLIQSRNQREGYYGNGRVPIVRGNKLYDCNDYVGNRGRISSVGIEIPVEFQSMYSPPVVDDSLQQYILAGCKEVLSSWASSQSYSALLQHYGGQVLGDMGGVNSLHLSQLAHSDQGLSRGKAMYNTVRKNKWGAEHRYGPRPAARVRNFVSYEKGLNESNDRKKIGERSAGIVNTVDRCDSLVLQTLYSSLAEMTEVQGNIYLMAKDQHGCRFLQKKFEDGSFEDVQTIFNEIIDHVVELMIDPFGNYLIQKLLDVCSEEQRMRIVNVVTKDRGELVKICLNTHGTRVVQKLIDGLKTRKQISLIIRALEPGFLDLIKDLNGNHVVQCCLQCLNYDDNKFIFDAASKFCVEIATHRHGCCVLQRCIAHSNGDHRKKVIEEICSNGLVLAQDPFGNYVVQYVIELKIPSAAAQLLSQFEGKYVHLSMQKFSSHVVEKCLKFIEESQLRIVYELLSVPDFEQLLQDPFANYVVQSALEVTKGALNESLVAAVRPHSMLRTNPYCKKIFTRGIVKK